MTNAVRYSDVLALLVLLLMAAPALAQVAPPWEALGGVEDGTTAAGAIAPLADGALLLLRDDLVLRRAPRGSWVEVLRGGRGTYLAASPGERPLALAVLGPSVNVSLDGGLSWRALDLPAGSAHLELSPAFDLDGVALYRADGRLFRSRDGGASWDERVLVPGQRVQQARFSPAFELDRTILAAVVSGPFPRLLTDTAAQSAADEHAASAGLLVSVDGGDTWVSPGPGPALQGAPFRHIQTLALSPSFGADGTLYAYAWGPRRSEPFMGGGPARTWQGALFRSADGGASWTVVQSSGEPAFQRGYAILELSPSLPLDDTLFLGLTLTGASPASSGCELLRSTDAGRSWEQLISRGSYEGCLGLVVSPRFTEDRAVLFGKMAWTVSLDGGTTWQGLGLEGGSAVEPVFDADFWLYQAVGGGAWRRPPFPDRDDLPTCAIVPAGGFGRLWRANDTLRTNLGCPEEPEKRLSVRSANASDGVYLQLSPDRAPLFLAGDGTLRPATLEFFRPDGWQEVELVSQRYTDGFLLWFAVPHPSIRALDLAAGRWRDFPDEFGRLN